MPPRHSHTRSSLLLDSSHSENESYCADIIKAIAIKFERFCLLFGSTNRQVEKTVSFSDKKTVHVLPSEPSGIFWIRKKDLLDLHQQKSRIFTGPDSIEFQVLDIIASVIEKSHLIYEELCRFIVRLNGYEVFLTQTNVEVDEETTIAFPNSEIFNKLQNNKEYFNEKANDLLNLLKPSYEINEYLFKLMKSMDKKTRIDAKLFGRLKSEAMKMNIFVRDLANKIQKCRMQLYIRYLSDIRIQTNNLEFKMITLDTANQYLDQDIKLIKEVSSTIDKNLELAMGIDFSKLYEFKAKFHELGNQALLKRPQ